MFCILHGVHTAGASVRVPAARQLLPCCGEVLYRAEHIRVHVLFISRT